MSESTRTDGQRPVLARGRWRVGFAHVLGLFALSVALGGGAFAMAQSDPVDQLSGGPPGAIVAYAGPTPPPGWLLADGSDVSRLQYAALFEAIGTTYGAGNGSTTFNLPDLRGRLAVGRGTHGEVDSLTDTDGLAVGSRKVKHRHSKGTISASGGSHSHSPTSGYFANFQNVLGGNGTNQGALSSSGNGHRLDVLVGSTDSDPHSHANSAFSGEVGDTSGPLNGPAYAVVNYIIKH